MPQQNALGPLEGLRVLRAFYVGYAPCKCPELRLRLARCSGWPAAVGRLAGTPT